MDMKITGNEKPIHGGLTIRQQFAMAAMQGLISCSARYGGEEDKIKLSEDAVDHADALINELNK